MLKVMRREDLIGDPNYDSPDARTQHREEVDAIVANWTKQHDKHEAMRLVSAACGAQADFVVMTVPHTPETRGMMTAREFQLMKKTAFLINIGRGACVVLDDLVAALRAGEIAGAGLDVYEIEPLPPDHPLWTMPGVLLTPHVAGYSPHIAERHLGLLLENIRRFVRGETLKNVVNKAQWF